MCGRYFLADRERPKDIQEIIDILNRTGHPVKTGDILPTDMAPVIANGRDLMPRPFLMRWGYEVNGRPLINARVETAAEKPLFADGMRQRRCLVPVCHYYEWERRGQERIRYAIAPEGEADFLMAGLYRINGDRAEYTILTREAAPEIGFIHDRMPVLMPAALKDAWLNPRNSAAEVLGEIRPMALRFGAM
ncbi:MAG: SOS response-associated peptidase [Clostridia bacterium]|nr:SOS response-associated peptidase [Clostridia bacterium]